ncbi:MAG: hypothetical protein HY713_04545 [candidate division NC10 bacterium]|nr:hypothetical protein [candidate division NC10 bacterium]
MPADGGRGARDMGGTSDANDIPGPGEPSRTRGRCRREPDLLRIAGGLARLTFGLRGFLRETISPETARDTMAAKLRSRDDAFLDLLARAVFANLASPYLQLFRAAGCEFGDAVALVRADGIEAALKRLRDAGVFVTFPEFKGQVAAVRGSRTFAFRPSDFDSPLITPSFPTSTGGTRGRPGRILIDLDHVAETAVHWAVWFETHGWLGSPLIFVTPMYPGIAVRQLRCAKLGRPFVKWFSTGKGGTPLYRAASAYVHFLARRASGVPRPEAVRLDEMWRVAEHVAALAVAGSRPCVLTSPSTAARVGLAAAERGLALDGVAFLLGGEPLTPARRATIESSGARAVATYGFSELGSVGLQCPVPIAPDAVHVLTDGIVLDARSREAGGATVDALLVTSIRSASPKIMINVEIGDTGVIERRPCDCLLGRLGLDQHLHTIRSFEKLTGEGATVLGADVTMVLEEVLPRRFGGSLAHYQLVETQDPRGLPRLTLLVSPEVGPLDERAVLHTFLAELAPLRPTYRFMVDQWVQTESVHVTRARPVPTDRGKVPAFRTLGEVRDHG